MAGVMEKIHQNTSGKDERSMFVFIACLTMLTFSLAASLITCRRHSRSPAVTRPVLLFGAITGLIIGFYSTVNLTLAGALDSIIYYPIANGGALLLTVLVSFFVFKEPLGKKKAAGVILGLLGVVCLSLPF